MYNVQLLRMIMLCRIFVYTLINVMGRRNFIGICRRSLRSIPRREYSIPPPRLFHILCQCLPPHLEPVKFSVFSIKSVSVCCNGTDPAIVSPGVERDRIPCSINVDAPSCLSAVSFFVFWLVRSYFRRSITPLTIYCADRMRRLYVGTSRCLSRGLRARAVATHICFAAVALCRSKYSRHVCSTISLAVLSRTTSEVRVVGVFRMSMGRTKILSGSTMNHPVN